MLKDKHYRTHKPALTMAAAAGSGSALAESSAARAKSLRAFVKELK
jgi:hypothetical protein